MYVKGVTGVTTQVADVGVSEKVAEKLKGNDLYREVAEFEKKYATGQTRNLLWSKDVAMSAPPDGPDVAEIVEAGIEGFAEGGPVGAAEMAAAATAAQVVEAVWDEYGDEITEVVEQAVETAADGYESGTVGE